MWFKVDESGKTADGLWAATDLLTASNSVYTFTIPPKLKAGQYIIRHEMYAHRIQPTVSLLILMGVSASLCTAHSTIRALNSIRRASKWR